MLLGEYLNEMYDTVIKGVTEEEWLAVKDSINILTRIVETSEEKWASMESAASAFSIMEVPNDFIELYNNKAINGLDIFIEEANTFMCMPYIQESLAEYLATVPTVIPDDGVLDFNTTLNIMMLDVYNDYAKNVIHEEENEVDGEEAMYDEDPTE